MSGLRNAIVGLGRIGSLLEDDPLREKPCTHAGAIALNRHCRLAGGCDISPGRQRMFARRWRCPHVYTSVDRLLKAHRPHILHVATPPSSHLQMVQKALRHGVRLVICEKPLTEDMASSYRIALAARRGRMKVLVNHERRYSNDYIKLKRIIQTEKYGNLFSVSAKLYMGRGRTCRETLWEDGTHLIDIIQYLCSSPLEAVRVNGDLEAPGSTCSILGKAGNTHVMMEVGTNRDYLVFELDLSFSEGRVRIGNGLYEEYASRRSPYYEGFNSLVPGEIVPFPKTMYFSNMLEDAVRCVREPYRVPVSSAEEGYRVVRILSSLDSVERSGWKMRAASFDLEESRKEGSAIRDTRWRGIYPSRLKSAENKRNPGSGPVF